MTFPPKCGSEALLVQHGWRVSGRQWRLSQHALTEQCEASSPVHLALEQLEQLEQLEPIDVSFDRPLAPRIAQGSAHRCLVTAEALRKANELGDTGVLALLQPGVHAPGSPFGDEGVK
jgi:hypothetical protein